MFCVCEPGECDVCAALVTFCLWQLKRRRGHVPVCLCLGWVLNGGLPGPEGLSEAVCAATAVARLVPMCVSALQAQSWYFNGIPSTEIPGWAPAARQEGSGTGSGGSGHISHYLTLNSQYIEDRLSLQLLICLSLNVCFESFFAEGLFLSLFWWHNLT